MISLNSPDTLFHWLRGFIDASPELPSETQWAQIKARVSSTSVMPMMPVIPPGYAPPQPHQPCGCKEKKAE